MFTSSDFQTHSYPLNLSRLPSGIQVKYSHDSPQRFSRSKSLYACALHTFFSKRFITIHPGDRGTIPKHALGGESDHVKRCNASCYRSCCLVVLFSPFSASLPTIFPRQKNIKQLMHLQLTGGGRVNSAGCIIYLLLRQGYHSMRQQSPFPPGPTAEACNHRFSSITISLSSTSSIYYRPTLSGDTTAPSLNSLQWKRASPGLDGSRRSSTSISSSRYQGMCCFTQLLTFTLQAKLIDSDGMGARSETEIVEPQQRPVSSVSVK